MAVAYAISLLLPVLLSISSGPAVHGASHHLAAPAPAPAVDCSSLILNMADCLSFVSSGSSIAKPEGSCCSGLKTVLKTDAPCLCEAFKSSASLGVTLNVTKALSLPAACKLHAPSVANCGLSVPPAGAPGLSPTAAAAGPEAAGASIRAPAPSPVNSASSLLPGALLSIVSGMLALLLSCI